MPEDMDDYDTLTDHFSSTQYPNTFIITIYF